MSDYNKNKYKNEIKKMLDNEKMQTAEPADKDLISKDNESSYNYPRGGAVERILKEVESSRENQLEKKDIQYGVQV